MIKIVSENELELIETEVIRKYVSFLLKRILTEYKEYCANGTISTIGAFYVLESVDELSKFKDMGLCEPITSLSYEWIDEFSLDFCNMSVVLDGNRAINIIGERNIFKRFLEEKNENI